MDTLFLLFGFFLVAFLYSGVGHGGASGYIALMILFGFLPQQIRTTALVLNVAVAAFAAFQFHRSGHFRYSLFWPFALTSVPMAWVGGSLSVDSMLYKSLLALCLAAAVFRLLASSGKEEEQKASRMPLFLALALGAVIGLISGMIGIGGGVLLSPILLLFRWSTVKQASAVAAPFIVVNSIAALLAGTPLKVDETADFGFILASVLTGGIIGSVLGSNRFSPVALRYLLATVLTIATVKLFF